MTKIGHQKCWRIVKVFMESENVFGNKGESETGQKCIIASGGWTPLSHSMHPPCRVPPCLSLLKRRSCLLYIKCVSTVYFLGLYRTGRASWVVCFLVVIVLSFFFQVWFQNRRAKF